MDAAGQNEDSFAWRKRTEELESANSRLKEKLRAFEEGTNRTARVSLCVQDVVLHFLSSKPS